MASSIRLSEEKRALFEKTEDEYDVTAGEQAYDKFIADGKKGRPIEELWKECDI